MRVLVTGGHGFLGRHVVRRAARVGHRLMLLGTPPPDSAVPAGAELVDARLDEVARWREPVRRFAPQACIHLAWHGIPDFSPSTCARNVSHTVQFFDGLPQLDAPMRLLVAGSCWEYGPSPGLCREDAAAPEPATFFAWAKESLRGALALLSAQRSIELFWLRIFFLYGPGQRRGSLVPSLYDALSAGRDPELRTPGACNDFVFVEDVAEAFTMALERGAPPGVYNLGSGTLVPVLDVCAAVEDLVSGHRVRTDRLRQGHAATPQGAARACTEKTSRLLGWTARTSLGEGIGKQVAALRGGAP